MQRDRQWYLCCFYDMQIKHECVSRNVTSRYLPGIGWHSPGHHPLQVTAQTDSFNSDDGLLCQDGAETPVSRRGNVNLCNTVVTFTVSLEIEVLTHQGCLGVGYTQASRPLIWGWWEWSRRQITYAKYLVLIRQCLFTSESKRETTITYIRGAQLHLLLLRVHYRVFLHVGLCMTGTQYLQTGHAKPSMSLMSSLVQVARTNCRNSSNLTGIIGQIRTFLLLFISVRTSIISTDTNNSSRNSVHTLGVVDHMLKYY